jgi:hypothetical protein
MGNLEKAIIDARDGFQPWTRDSVRHVLKCVTCRLPGAQYDWDETNENWGVISRTDQGIAYICAKVPLIVVAGTFAAEVKECVKDNEAVIFEVNNFDHKEHKVAKHVLEAIFGKMLTNVVSYEALSIRDLWYATVN